MNHRCKKERKRSLSMEVGGAAQKVLPQKWHLTLKGEEEEKWEGILSCENSTSKGVGIERSGPA